MAEKSIFSESEELKIREIAKIAVEEAGCKYFTKNQILTAAISFLCSVGFIIVKYPQIIKNLLEK